MLAAFVRPHAKAKQRYLFALANICSNPRPNLQRWHVPIVHRGPWPSIILMDKELHQFTTSSSIHWFLQWVVVSGDTESRSSAAWNIALCAFISISIDVRRSPFIGFNPRLTQYFVEVKQHLAPSPLATCTGLREIRLTISRIRAYCF